MMAAVVALAPAVGARAACEAMGVSPASFYRSQAPRSPAPATPRPSPPRALGAEERQVILDVLHSERFADSSPAEVYATLLDEGVYLASERTLYRVLDGAGEVKERRNQLRHPAHKRPELLATRPNQVWSWDISKLLGPAKWTYLYLYVIIDIFSRYVVGWMVAHGETAALAERLIAETIAKQEIVRDTLSIHADRGSSMTSKPVALLLADLGVTKTHSRPYTSTDNPYSEAHFRTMKYRPSFPASFGCIEDARGFCQGFFTWYNACHHHVGIGLMTPEDVHYGRAQQVYDARTQVLLAAYDANPERFVRKLPTPPDLPKAAWINPPTSVTGKEGPGQ